MSIFKTKPNGKTGIKRTVGFSLICISVILALVDMFTKHKVNQVIWLAMFGAGTTLIGMSAIPKLNQQ